MQEIADRAGINKALLHYYFRDKEGLYQATIQSVVDDVFLKVSAPVLGSNSPKSPEEAVRLFIRSYMTVLRNNPDLVGMVLRELADGGKHLAPLTENLSKAIQQFSAKVFGSSNILLNKNAPQLMINMASMIWGTFLLRPFFSRILPQAGFALSFDDSFYEGRIESISAIILREFQHANTHP